MSEHAEISITSLESIKDVIGKTAELLKEFKTHIKAKRTKKIDQINALIICLDTSREIIQECIDEPLHDGYLS